VLREPNLITVQQNAAVFSLLHFCGQLYMFRVLPSSGAGTAVITACGTGQPDLLPSAVDVELELIQLNNDSGWLVDPINQYQKL